PARRPGRRRVGPVHQADQAAGLQLDRPGPHGDGPAMTVQRYRALLAGNWQYFADTHNLPDLKGPLNDISRMAAALSDQELGMFAWRDIRTLPERASHEILYAAESFFQCAANDEVLFFYYSGHCLTDEDGALLLCG